MYPEKKRKKNAESLSCMTGLDLGVVDKDNSFSETGVFESGASKLQTVHPGVQVQVQVQVQCQLT